VTDDLDDVRAKLTARRDACFDRIDDAISELIAVHLVEPGEIRARVEASILHEQQLTDE
jgi:hypothetical protein